MILNYPQYGPMTLQQYNYAVWEQETLAYAPDYYTLENDYDDDYDVCF